MSIRSTEPASTPAPAAQRPFRWFPIRSLGPQQRSRIQAHLMSLGPDDRYLRFGYPASDAHIGRYVEQLDFERDELFGVFNRRLELIAMAHLAFLGREGERPSAAEFGVSVLPHGRGRGIGSRLFERAGLHARNRGIDTLIVHALSENLAMLKIARQAGAQVGREGPDATAILQLPPEDLGSHWSQVLAQHAGDLDYSLKRHALQLNRLVRTVRGFMPGATRDPG
jgi:GNAT superfamily N-acetyltransferase